LISVMKLLTPQITAQDHRTRSPHKITAQDHRTRSPHRTGSVLGRRSQTPGLGGGGRERPSGREPPPAKLLRLWPTAKNRWSDRAARVRQACARKAESTSHKTNASHMNAETSQH